MSSEFHRFASRVREQFQVMATDHELFVTDTPGDDLYDAYIAAFPEGTNPLYVKRTEHECGTCRHFIRNVGNVVAIRLVDKTYTVVTPWDIASLLAPHPYDIVATKLAAKVRAAKVVDLFRVELAITDFGAEVTRSRHPDTLEVIEWHHFSSGPLPDKFHAAMPDTICGGFRTNVQVFQRGLTELTPDAVNTVMELIENNDLYRGQEHRAAVERFQQLQQVFLTHDAESRLLFPWVNGSNPAAAGFRNTVIGTLVQDISNGSPVADAVRAFETKMGSYMRTSAPITQSMVKKAMETIQALDLESALERRLAKLDDISVNDVLWVDSSARPLMKGGIGDALMAHAEKNVEAATPKGEDITYADFMEKILPKAKGVEILFKPEHVGNLMVLTAPVHPEVKHLFPWENDFAWSYTGNITDSIKERVKAAGGRVDNAVLRVSLSWFNYDDLDLHIIEPNGGEIYYASRVGVTGGVLDVDMNAGHGTSRTPVENVVWVRRVPDGIYKLRVHNFCRRETTDPGFVIEVENGGALTHYSYNKLFAAYVHVCNLHVRDNRIERVTVVDPGITTGALKQERWGLTAGQFVKVNTVTLSPNYWGGHARGNKHTFFVLDGAVCDEEMRGIYNEFLHSRLHEHRKVFEVIGNQTKCQITANHLAGLGFSSTKKDTFVVRVRSDKSLRTYNVRID